MNLRTGMTIDKMDEELDIAEAVMPEGCPERLEGTGFLILNLLLYL